jgi:hypothetical protein
MLLCYIKYSTYSYITPLPIFSPSVPYENISKNIYKEKYLMVKILKMKSSTTSRLKIMFLNSLPLKFILIGGTKL